MPKLNLLVRGAMRHPLLWGAAATAGFYLALDSGVVEEPLVARYFAGHWAAYVCTTMFLVGMAALIVKSLDLLRDLRGLGTVLFDGVPAADLRVADVALLSQGLDKQPAWAQGSYLIRRLRAALDYLSRKGSPDTLEDELRALADQDAERKAASYGIVRTMLWTMPFMGALGTVLGLASIISTNVPAGAAGGLPANLPPGFALILDTTVLALLLTVSLLVAMLIAEHFENRLLAAVDARTSRELIGRFRCLSAAKSIQPVAAGATASSGMSDTMVETMEKIAERQSEIWQASLDAATKHWEEQTELLIKQMGSGGALAGGGRGSGGGAGGKGAAGAMGANAAGANGAGGPGLGGPQVNFSEAIAATISGLGSANLVIHNEIMSELAEVVGKGCRNWPYRKRLRRGWSRTAAIDESTEWLDKAS